MNLSSKNSVSPFSLEGQTALITGGGSGLGLGMARCFVQAGAKVVLVGRRASVLSESAKWLGPNASWVAHDICDTGATDELLLQASRRAESPISILVNNAGIHLRKPAVETSAEEFESVLQTHVLAAHSLTRAALPSMIEQGR
ncbi:MAG: SDR family oxidoreductase, partial [Planctomycetota bacterium]